MALTPVAGLPFWPPGRHRQPSRLEPLRCRPPRPHPPGEALRLCHHRLRSQRTLPGWPSRPSYDPWPAVGTRRARDTGSRNTQNVNQGSSTALTSAPGAARRMPAPRRRGRPDSPRRRNAPSHWPRRFLLRRCIHLVQHHLRRLRVPAVLARRRPSAASQSRSSSASVSKARHPPNAPLLAPGRA